METGPQINNATGQQQPRSRSTMNGAVVLTETATIWLLEIDGDCLLCESDSDISAEDAIDLADSASGPSADGRPGRARATQTVTPPMVSEKEQTVPLILKVLRLLDDSVVRPSRRSVVFS